MRAQFYLELSALVEQLDDVCVLLGDIGTWPMKKAIEAHPDRVINFGIMEQAMTSFGAGLSARGLYPILHTITPFLIERPLEQIKIDFGYQNLPALFASVGGSYDYSKLGGTHHSPADVAIMASIPGVRIYTPISEESMARALWHAVQNSELAYLRLSENGLENLKIGEEKLAAPSGSKFVDYFPGTSPSKTRLVLFGDAVRTIPIFRKKGYDGDILACSMVNLRDIGEIARWPQDNSPLVILEPWFEGSVAFANVATIKDIPVTSVGFQREFIHGVPHVDNLLDDLVSRAIFELGRP